MSCVQNAERNFKTMKATVAFTLPISCQICLAKVKHPVCCENHHVFCKVCIDIWTNRNKHCPTCRVPMNDSQPYRELLGGQSLDTDEDQPAFSQPLIRKARVKSLFSSYEEEIERLNDKLAILQRENVDLRASLQNRTHGDLSPAQKESLEAVQQKLTEATLLYQNINAASQKIQKENEELQRTNTALSRENQSLRYDLALFSPRKFGRFTVAALESQISTHKAEIANLEKALARSDQIIEQLQSRLPAHQTLEDMFMNHLPADQNREKPLQTQLPANHAGETSEGYGSDLVIGDLHFKSAGNGKVPEPTISSIKRTLFDKPQYDSELTSTLPTTVPVHPQLDSSSSVSKLISTTPNSPQFVRDRGCSGVISKKCKNNILDSAAQAARRSVIPKSVVSPVTALLSEKAGMFDNTTLDLPESFHLGELSHNVGELSHHFTSPLSTPTKRKLGCDSSFTLEMPSPETPSCHMKRLVISKDPASLVFQSANCLTSTANSSDDALDCTVDSTQREIAEISQLDSSLDALRDLDDHNITVTDELTDCLKLINTAERNVRSRAGASSGGST